MYLMPLPLYGSGGRLERMSAAYWPTMILSDPLIVTMLFSTANSTPGGGHISHHKDGSVGKYTKNIVDFPLTEDGYHTDVDKTRELVRALRPKLLIFGKSLFLFPEPLEELRELCDKYGIVMLYDAAHVLGLVAGKRFQDPLREGADMMTGSTHKTFFGSQRGLILSNTKDAIWRKIDQGAFPGSSSNHHLDTLVPLAITTYEIIEFGEAYAAQVTANAKALAKALDECGFEVQGREFDYTETHQVAVDVRSHGGGDEVARILQDNGVILNMNLLPFEPLKNVLNPAGIRIGTQEMTRFGMKEDEMRRIAELIKKCLKDGQPIDEDVKELRGHFTKVAYSFDAD
jgi:glycine hydroxymethyltransferase